MACVELPSRSSPCKLFLYRPDPRGHLLYSPGPEGIDDGGQPVDNDWSGDILVQGLQDAKNRETGENVAD
jgi:hypothetical protein